MRLEKRSYHKYVEDGMCVSMNVGQNIQVWCTGVAIKSLLTSYCVSIKHPCSDARTQWHDPHSHLPVPITMLCCTSHPYVNTLTHTHTHPVCTHTGTQARARAHAKAHTLDLACKLPRTQHTHTNTHTHKHTPSLTHSDTASQGELLWAPLECCNPHEAHGSCGASGLQARGDALLLG